MLFSPTLWSNKCDEYIRISSSVQCVCSNNFDEITIYKSIWNLLHPWKRSDGSIEEVIEAVKYLKRLQDIREKTQDNIKSNTGLKQWLNSGLPYF